MPPKSNSRRANFHPFWPVTVPDANAHITPAPTPEQAQELNSRDNEKSKHEHGHNAERHEYLWKLMRNYIPGDKESIQSSFVSHIEYTCTRSRFDFDNFSAYLATSYSVRDRLIELFNDTQEYFISQKMKHIYYVSIEFLVGRFLRNALLNLELEDAYRDALQELDVSIDQIYNEEYDPGLGNGGLGRLAACFMDSLATLNLPAWGYGLMYSFGMFKQTIGPDGSQMEVPDYWLNYGDPWRVQKPDVTYPVFFYGRCEGSSWHPSLTINAVANDFMIPGFATDNTLGLRLWSSSPAEELDPEKFRHGDYYEAITQKQRAENLTSVLYPNDNTDDGKEMRLMQEFFMSSATLQDIIHRLKNEHKAPIQDLPKYAAVQLNDTHPAVMVAELLRILIDEEKLTFKEAYDICTQVFSYTCHTLMPEALEKWNINLFEKVLPRHLQIIYMLNQNFLEELRYRFRVDDSVVSSLSIIEEGYTRQVRMANLAVIGSHTVNGVAAIHSELMKEFVFHDFYHLFPTKFQNKTNGVTVRRWLHHCNPELAQLITQVVGNHNWALTTDGLKKLNSKINDTNFCSQWAAVKFANKNALANYIESTLGVRLNPSVQLFDVQVKRIHEYKRQTLNILGVIYRYLQILDGNTEGMQPRAVLIGGKAAPGYYFAKKLIKLINNVARVINNDNRVGDLLKLLYLPNYNVSLAELIIPAADINEQISTAGTEASGTSNMKFAFNSSLIVGTWDGANIEIGEAIGNENVFFFGTKVDDVEKIRAGDGRKISKKLNRVFKVIRDGMFGDGSDYQIIIDSIVGKDHYLCGQDFDAFIEIQQKVDEAYQDKENWTKMGILSTANMGPFSSDRTIHEYATQIWHATPCPLPRVVLGPDNTPVLQSSSDPEEHQKVGSLRRHHQGSLPNGAQGVVRHLPPIQKSDENDDESDGGIPIGL